MGRELPPRLPKQHQRLPGQPAQRLPFAVSRLQPCHILADLIGEVPVDPDVADDLPAGDPQSQLPVFSTVSAALGGDEPLPPQGIDFLPA